MRLATPIIVLAVATGIARALRRRQPVPEIELRFRSPVGQDPAAVLGKLHRAGVTAVPDLIGGETEVVISCPPGDRERVRSVIADAPRDMDGDPLDSPSVRFSDE